MRDLRMPKKYMRKDVKTSEWFRVIGTMRLKALGLPPRQACDLSITMPSTTEDDILLWHHPEQEVSIEGREGKQTVSLEDMRPGQMYVTLGLPAVAFVAATAGRCVIVASEDGCWAPGSVVALRAAVEGTFARCFIDEMAENPNDRIVLIDDIDE